MKEEKEKGMWGGEGKGKDPTHVMIFIFCKTLLEKLLSLAQQQCIHSLS